MRKLVLLFAALLVAGCGEKSSSEGSESASEKPTAPSETPNSLSDADVERLLKEAVDMESLEERDDLYYQPNESEPFSGWAKTMSDSEYGKGLTQFKDGKPDGPHTVWYGNGQKWGEGTFKDGEPDGPFTQWYGNGQKKMSASMKDGNEDGLQTYWYKNGQKRSEGTFKDGEKVGLQTEWHENGQKKEERTYKDGKELSAKYWNSKGEEVEMTLEGLGSVVPVPEPNPDSNVLKGKTFGKFTILDEVQTDYGDRSLAKKNAENTLGKYPEVDAMVGLWAYNAPQCLEALKDANKLGEVKVFSFDEDPVTLAAIKEGHCEGTVVQDPYNFGYQSMRHLKEIVVDDKMPDLDEGKNIPVPIRTIVKDNVEEFRKTVEDRLAAGEAAKGAEAPADAPKFAFITNVADPFWSHAEAGCYVAAKEFGVAVEFQMNSAGDIAGQKKIVENILNKGDCKGIAISVLNPANQTEMINNAADQLPLITCDSDAPDSKRLFFLGTDNYQAGRELGKLLKKSMPEGGRIMLYVGMINQLNSIPRRDGLLDELSGQIRTDN